MKILAFLQNAYFKDPIAAKRIFDKYPGRRNYLIAQFLFMGCLTGRRLKRAFGETTCNEIVWEEISPEIGGHSSSKFPADLDHIQKAIEIHKPEIILCFGKIAENALTSVYRLPSFLLADSGRPAMAIMCGPHPAARQDPMPKLREMADKLTLFKNSRF